MAAKPLSLLTNGSDSSRSRPADVVPDGFERSAFPAERFQVGLILGQQGITWGQDHVAALGELAGVLAVLFSAEADYDAVANFVVGRMQAQDGRRAGVAFLKNGLGISR